MGLTFHCRSYFGDPQSFMDEIIKPVLTHIKSIPQESGAPQLLLGTALHESGGLKHRRQIRGPAMGLFQMEPATHNDIWANYLKYQKTIAAEIMTLTLSGTKGTASELEFNDNYAAAMCRVHYHRLAKVVPGHGQISAHANTWKTYYNTIKGKGTVEKYIKDWKTYGGGKVKAV